MLEGWEQGVCPGTWLGLGFWRASLRRCLELSVEAWVECRRKGHEKKRVNEVLAGCVIQFLQ